MNNQATGGWGEIPKTEPELKYPEWMSLDYNPRRRIRRRKRINADRVTQIVMTVAMIAAVVVMAVMR